MPAQSMELQFRWSVKWSINCHSTKVICLPLTLDRLPDYATEPDQLTHLNSVNGDLQEAEHPLLQS